MTIYSSGEEVIYNLILTLDGFSAANVDRGNWLILNRGASKIYAIIANKNDSKVEPLTLRSDKYTHVTAVEIWRKFEEGALQDLLLKASAVADKLSKTYLLGDTSGTIMSSQVLTELPVEEMWSQGAKAPAWLRKTILVQWDEVVSYA